MRWISRMAPLALAVLALMTTAPVQAGDDTPTVKPQELLSAMKTDPRLLVLDVRTPKEYDSGHVPGAINVPYDQLPARVSEVTDRDPDRVVVYCERGGRAAKAEKTLKEAGVENVQHLEGDMQGWRRDKLPTKRPLESVQKP